MFMAPGYGHMDFLFGQNAHKDVYLHLCKFLNAPSAFVSSWNADADGSAIPGQWRDNDLAALRKPLTGPHIRLREAGESDLERRELILWAEFANDPTHPVAAPALCDAQGHPLAGWSATALAHHHLDPENQREITLLDGPGAYWTGRLTEQTPGAFQNMDSLVLKRGPDGLLGEAKLSWAHLFWWQRWIGLRPIEIRELAGHVLPLAGNSI